MPRAEEPMPSASGRIPRTVPPLPPPGSKERTSGQFPVPPGEAPARSSRPSSQLRAPTPAVDEPRPSRPSSQLRAATPALVDDRPDEAPARPMGLQPRSVIDPPPRAQIPSGLEPLRRPSQPRLGGEPRPKTPPHGVSETLGIDRPTQSHHRPPTEPEIEAYLEIEAEAPPERAGSDPDFESVLVTSFEDGHARVTQTVEDNSSKMLAVTEIELEADEPPHRPVTAEDGSTASGTIAERQRAKRISDNWDD
jgi:hypothetical protein